MIKNIFFCQMQWSTCLSTFSGEVVMDPVLKTLCYFSEYKMMDTVQKLCSAKCIVTHKLIRNLMIKIVYTVPVLVSYCLNVKDWTGISSNMKISCCVSK